MSPDAPPPPEDNNGPSGGGGAPFKMSFGAIKGKGKGIARPTTAPVRPTGAFGAASTEAPAERHVDELIRGLDGNKIESLAPQEEAKPLVIPKEENSNWRQEALSKRKRAYLPEGSSATQSHNVSMETEEADETRVGLQISKRVKVESTTVDRESSAMDVDVNTTTTTTTTTTTVVTDEIVEDAKEETLEEMAARRLLEAVNGGPAAGSRRLVLHGDDNVQKDEVESFQKNLEQLPDEASLEDYANVPVEEFGAALLRGMGWKGDNNGSEAVEYNRRPALLGLGAKPREPEPSKKKYIKPGESRMPQSIPVPSRSSTARPSGQTNQRDSRVTRDTRDTKDPRDSRDHRDRDSRDSRSTRDDRDHRDRRDRDERDDRNSRGESSREYRDRERDRDRDTRDTRDTKGSRDARRDDRGRDRDRDYRMDDKKDDRRDDRDRSSRDDRGGERRRDRSRDRERDRDRSSRR
ncbi:hypothetical protein BGZ96_000455 [Linnemannia gamsii]|uniref:Spp2/MOS2 G-patch domain-containing protein n=1 Tax=Linnemannia gamsii TaxID=64522 RepID=A0ABQ7K9Z7_9FUNG|nr:hypothetical protein BGZ96_000455 [Linnemannia gamsii]